MLRPPRSQRADKNEVCLSATFGGEEVRVSHTHTHIHTTLVWFRHWDTVHTCLKLKQRSQVCGIHIIIVAVIGLWVVFA